MPDRSEKRLALLEAEIKRLKLIVALDPDDLMSKSALSSYIETVYLLKSPPNVRHLTASVEEYRSGKLVSQSIEELRKELEISLE